MTDPALALVGQSLSGRYRVETILGRGGQGVVYRAHDVQSGRSVAVKVLSELLARDPQAAGRFLREQEALAALAGTAAVQAYDAGELPGGSLYLVLELLEGRDLEEELELLERRKQRMDLQRIAELLAPIVETLDIAHRQGIFHRDLKPANIFLLKGGEVRLLDFGFARLKTSQPLTAVGTVMGSPSYIAPEVWRGRPELLDYRVDVYSLGVVLYRLLSGDMPFESANVIEVFKMATSAPRPSLHQKFPYLPASIDEWVERSLAIDRERRYQTTGECVEALYRCLGAAHVLAPIRASIRRRWDEQHASAATRIASVLQSAAAALKRWAAVSETKPKPEPQAPAAKKRPATARSDVSPARNAASNSRSFPMIPKLAPKAPRPLASPPAGGRPSGRILTPPPHKRPGTTQPDRELPRRPPPPPARRPLPPPPIFGGTRRKTKP